MGNATEAHDPSVRDYADTSPAMTLGRSMSSIRPRQAQHVL